MSASLTFWLLALALLTAYLFRSVRARHRAEEVRRRRARESQLPWIAFDVSTIAPQIQRVRRDYVAAAHHRARHSSHRAGLLAAARRLVKSLPYFRRDGHGAFD